MPDWLVLEARFLAEVYRGAEWPPSPFKLLQALVAGNRSVQAPGLAWLERQPPPAIFVPAGVPESRYTIFVPNNSDRRKPKAATTQREVIERRVRRPVRYVFRLRDDADRDEARHLIATGSRLHTFGSGQDQASLSGFVTDCEPASEPQEAHFAPSHAGRLIALRSEVDVPLRVPIPGSLASLEERFQAGLTRLDRSDKGWFSPVVPPARHEVVAYSPVGQAPRLAMYPLRLLEPGNREALRPFDPRNAVIVAAQLRNAIMQRTAGTRVADFAAGYSGTSDPDCRLSWVPLPSVGRTHTDGLIRRAMLLAPIACLTEMADLLAPMGEEPLHLISEGTGEWKAGAELADPDDGVFNAYRRESRTWTSITPVVLPGDYAGEPRLVRNLVLKSLRNAGIDVGLLADFAVSRTPFLRQAHHVAEYRLKA